jgi:eukaryotic-like serine/threonine-protein kinase
VVLPHTADRVGQVLGGRYRLVAPLGSGASATVYLGDDVTLRRRVAVKVLHPALADDKAFLHRFRAEAQAAAALNHPNVLAVHDWGQDGTTPYLVSEFLAGGSLRSMLDASGPLTPSQTLVVGLEAARGLAYAHRRGLVHRDIKPANLLFDDEARLRIADFGLARALAEAAWTEPMGAVLGTARYASPEQARGESLDGRSDVYSLALVLVEVATGTVPFSADTTLGTLMARVDMPMPVPEGLGPLGDVLTAAGAPDPADRPDADELSTALFDAARQMDRPGPLPLMGSPVANADHDTDLGASLGAPGAADADATVIDRDRDNQADAGLAIAAAAAMTGANPVMAGPGTETIPVAEGPATVANAVVEGPATESNAVMTGPVGAGVATGVAGAGVATGAADAGVADTDVAGAGVAGAGVTDAGSAGAAGPEWLAAGGGDLSAGAGGPAGPDDPTNRARRRRRWPLVVALLAVVALVAGSLFWWSSVRVVSAEVPALVGVAVSAAEQAALDGDWELIRSEAFDPVVAAGLVVSQDPAPGVMLPKGGQLTVVVSAGPAPVPVPDGLVGAPLPEVEQRLVEVGLTLGSVDEAFDEAVPAGVVTAISAEPGVELPFGEAVNVRVSAGPEPRTLPNDLVGRALDEVRGLLEALGLPVQVGGEAFSDSIPAGRVIEAAPGPGQTVARGTPVVVEVSLGPPVVQVPDVTGESVVVAAAQLEAAGLVVTSLQGSPSRSVTGTSPSAGTTVRIGSNITITTR